MSAAAIIIIEHTTFVAENTVHLLLHVLKLVSCIYPRRQIVFGLDEYTTPRELLSAVNSRFMAGTTNTSSALRVLQQMFSEQPVVTSSQPDIAVIITDGKSDDL